MSRLTVTALLLALALATTAAAANRPVVPRMVQVQIEHDVPGRAYVPTRMALGFRYTEWQKTPAMVQVTFVNKANWEIRFVVARFKGACRTGMEKSFQLDGNKVYWSRTAAGQQAWRCILPAHGYQVRVVASSPQPPTVFADVGLGRVVASGARIAA